MTLDARLLGTFRMSLDGIPVEAGSFERPSGLRLLKLLLATPGHALRREQAADVLWPELDADRSSAQMRKAVHFARRALGTAGLPSTAIDGGAVLRLHPDLPVAVDADRLREAVDAALAARALGKSVPGDAIELLAELGGEELLPEDAADEWLLPLRERLHRDVVEALLVAAADARSSGRLALASRLVDRLLALEPAEEEAHRLAIELHLDRGRLDAARRQLALCAVALADAYGVAPAPRLRALIDAASPIAAVADAEDPGIGTVLVGALVETIRALASDQAPADHPLSRPREAGGRAVSLPGAAGRTSSPVAPVWMAPARRVPRRRELVPLDV